MLLAVRIVGAALTIVAVLSFAWLVIESIAYPSTLARRDDSTRREMLILIAQGIGAVILVYGAVYQALWWMPGSWGSHGEEGDWRPTRAWSAGIAAAYLGFLLIAWLHSNARSSHQLHTLRFKCEEIERLLRMGPEEIGTTSTHYDRAAQGDLDWVDYPDMPSMRRIDRSTFQELSRTANSIGSLRKAAEPGAARHTL